VLDISDKDSSSLLPVKANLVKMSEVEVPGLDSGSSYFRYSSDRLLVEDIWEGHELSGVGIKIPIPKGTVSVSRDQWQWTGTSVWKKDFRIRLLVTQNRLPDILPSLLCHFFLLQLVHE
jgi:hypothetical protein